jgi:hypothetical protein
MTAAQRAATADELRRVLAVGDLQRDADSDAGEAVALLERHHGTDDADAVDTALLLATSQRWAKVTTEVIAAVAASGVLDDGALDELARRVCWVQRARFDHPAAWHAGGWVEVDLDTLDTRHVAADPDERLHSLRLIAPPLRRWAAGRLVGRRHADPRTLRARADGLESRDRQAVTLGILDALDALDPQDQSQVLEHAVANSDGRVRRLALERVLERDGLDAVVRLAAGDSSQGIRQWVDQLRAGRGGAQPSLFG